MTLEEYKERTTDGIIYRMGQEISEHDRGYMPSSVTEEFYLNDLLSRLVRADGQRSPCGIRLHGYSLEIHAEKRWPVVFYFRQGKILMGRYFLKVDCLERAVEDIRFLMTLIPKYAEQYTSAMANAALEMQKEMMIRQIIEATLIPSITEILKGRGLTCTTRRNSTTITLNLFMRKEKVRTFRLPYDGIKDGINDIRDYVTARFPMAPEALPASADGSS